MKAIIRYILRICIPRETIYAFTKKTIVAVSHRCHENILSLLPRRNFKINLYDILNYWFAPYKRWYSWTNIRLSAHVWGKCVQQIFAFNMLSKGTSRLGTVIAIYLCVCVSKIKQIFSAIHYTIYGAVCFQFTHFTCDDWENIHFVLLSSSSNRKYALLSIV